jgi:hypothetical protein
MNGVPTSNFASSTGCKLLNDGINVAGGFEVLDKSPKPFDLPAEHLILALINDGAVRNADENGMSHAKITKGPFTGRIASLGPIIFVGGQDDVEIQANNSDIQFRRELFLNIDDFHIYLNIHEKALFKLS